MGRDKALLPRGEGTLLDHALARLRQVTSDVRILCGPEPRYGDRGVPLVVDVFQDAGALGGVCSGLIALERSYALILAVDVPELPPALLAALVAQAPGWDAVVPFSPRGPEPLCAVYAKTCLGPIRDRLAAGEYRMTAFWPEVRVRTLAPSELAVFGPADRLFANVNTPADYAR
jgi:molybdopterin-guanine dinucleotide biosynthesis protein A